MADRAAAPQKNRVTEHGSSNSSQSWAEKKEKADADRQDQQARGGQRDQGWNNGQIHLQTFIEVPLPFVAEATLSIGSVLC
jgi:hypothetical protein